MLDLSTAETNLARIHTQITTADGKGSIVFALCTAMLGVLAALVSSVTPCRGLGLWASAVSAVALFLALLAVAASAFPRTRAGRPSLSYFGSISTMTTDEFLRACDAVDETQFRADLLIQCHRNAEIATAKFQWLRRAMIFLFVSAVPWLVAVAALTAARS